MRYRRANAAGATYFFTVNLADRRSRMLLERVAELRSAVRLVQSRHRFDIIAWVVLPDHLHAIWTLPPDDADFSTRWALIKAGFSRQISADEPIGTSRRQKDLRPHVDYIHYNPVKHGHVSIASEWPHSTIHRYIRAGLMTADWAAPQADAFVAGE